MKRSISLIIVTSLILFGCQTGNKENVENTNVEHNSTKKQTENRQIFTKEDRKTAKEKAEKYLVLLTEFHGKTVRTSEDYRTVQNQMNQRADELGVLHESVYIVSPTSIVQDDNDFLILRMENFKLGEEITEKHYEYINAHELIIPCTYTTPKNSKNINYNFKFIKTLDGDIQIVDALLVNGMNLERMDEDAYYDEYNRKEMQKEVKGELKIQ